MRLFTAILIVGIAIVGNSYAEGRDKDHDRWRHGGHGGQGGQGQFSQIRQNQPVVAPRVQINQPVVVPQVQQFRQTNPTVVRERNRPSVQQVQEFRQSVRPQRTEIRRNEVTRVRQQREPVAQQFQRTVQPTIIQSSQQVRRDVSRVDRERHRHDRGHGWRHNQRNNTTYYYYGGAGFGYPYISAPYTGYSYGTYPNRYFICYTIDQADEDSVHVSCPYGTGWYSTSPRYDTYQYRTAYRPEYVCPQYGADQFIEFSSSSEANNWWNQNCDEWIDNPNSDY